MAKILIVYTTSIGNTKELAGKKLMATGNVAPPPDIVKMFQQS